MPTRTATSRNVRPAMPFCRATSHAAVRISCRVASRRSACLSRLGVPIMVRHSAGRSPTCQAPIAMTDCRPRSPTEFVQARVVDTEVVTHFVHDSGPHLIHHLLLGAADCEDCLTKYGDSI